MSKLSRRDVCRLCLDGRASNREVGRLAGISPTTVNKYRSLLKVHGITPDTLGDISDESLDDLLQATHKGNRKEFLEPDWVKVYEDYQKRDVTISLLYGEYMEAAKAKSEQALRSESSFTRKLREYCNQNNLSMRQEHLPGHVMFVDFSGKHLYLTDPRTGAKSSVELFVAALGASRMLFVTAVKSQQKADWVEANVRALEYFKGVPTVIVPDNLKSAVIKPKRRGQPATINKAYLDFSDHYNTTIVPARPERPQDKALAEIGVRITNIWIISALRNHVFHDLATMNTAIAPLVERINEKVTRSLRGHSRRDLFESLEAPALNQLPARRHEYLDWSSDVRVPKDYHIQVRKNFYSVPHHLVGGTITYCISRTTIKIFSKRSTQPVAVHQMQTGDGQTCTRDEHMPERHRLYRSLNVQDLLEWSSDIHAEVRTLFEAILANKRIPSISAIRQMATAQKLNQQYGRERFVDSCRRANAVSIQTIESVANILKNEIDLRTYATNPTLTARPVPHENLRGPNAYSGE